MLSAFVRIFGVLGFVCAVALGHGDHSSPAEKEEHLLNVEKFLAASFLELKNVASPAPEKDFILSDEQGEKRFIPQSQVAMAIVQAALLVQEEHHHSHRKLGYLGAWIHWLGHKYGSLKKSLSSREEMSRAILAQWAGMGGFTVNLTGYAAKTVYRYGLVPLAFVIITFPPYFIGTEFVESMVVGPFHGACHVFLFAYFSSMAFLLGNMGDLVYPIFSRGSSAGLASKFFSLISNRWTWTGFCSAMRKIFELFVGSELEPPDQILSYSVFWKAIEGREIPAAPVVDDIEAVFAAKDAATRQVFLSSLLDGLNVLFQMSELRAKLAMELGHLGTPQFMKTQLALGRIGYALDHFQRALWIGVAEKDLVRRDRIKAWAKDTYREFLAQLEEIQKPELSWKWDPAEKVKSLLTAVSLFHQPDLGCHADLLAAK